MTASFDQATITLQRREDQARERAQLLLHIAVANPHDAEELARRIARPKKAIHEDLKILIAEGVVHVHGGALRTSVAARIIADTPASEVQEVHDQILAEFASGKTVRSGTLVALVESGCVDRALLGFLINHVSAHPEDAPAMSALTQVARAHALTEESLMLLRAHYAALRGLPGQVLSFTDSLLTHESSAVYRPAALLAAGAHIQGNRLERAEALYLHAGQEQIGYDCAWAVVATLGQGKADEAEDWRSALRPDSLTSLSAGLHEFTEALMLSIDGNGEGALDILARAVSTLSPLGPDAYLPETPASVAAIIAIGRGEPATAQVFLERALKANLGGVAGTQRHWLLMAWTLTVQGNVAAAEKILNTDVVVESLCDRDRFLHWCLRAAIARRRTDITSMRHAWQEIRGHTFGMKVTLFDLLPLGEMTVIAARLHDSDRAHELVNDGMGILARLGDPAVWSAPLHWHCVQAAFQAEDATRLLPHANALAKASAASPYAATLAQAGHTWLEMLRGDTDFGSVETSARALAAKGHVWDAARLAGQAALLHPRRDGALSMMQLAREIDKDRARRSQSGPQASSLTSRELEVARLVLDGQGYRAIGEQLFISPKTVEHHVARIRGRLGATSRGDLLEKLHDEVTRLD